MKNIKRKNINFIYDIINMRVEGEQRYFTAEEAKRVSNEVSKEQMNAELDEVYDKINEARFKGNTSVVIGKFFKKSTVEFLKGKGFTVKEWSGSQWDPATDTTISW